MTNIVKYFVICIVSNTFFISPGVCQNNTSDSTNILYSDSDSDLRDTNEYEYSKMLTIGKKWVNTLWDPNDNKEWDLWRSVESCEVINGLEVYTIITSCEHAKWDSITEYAFEKDKKVYSCKKDGSCPVQYFDFSITVGDIVDHRLEREIDDRWICVEDTIEEKKGISRRILKLQSTSYNYTIYWVEGIGAKKISDTMISYPFPIGSYQVEYGFKACYQDDTLIFDVEDFNMTNEVKELHCDEYNLENRSKELYDLSGKKLIEYPKGEIFIENGKKRIMF